MAAECPTSCSKSKLGLTIAGSGIDKSVVKLAHRASRWLLGDAVIASPAPAPFYLHAERERERESDPKNVSGHSGHVGPWMVVGRHGRKLRGSRASSTVTRGYPGSNQGKKGGKGSHFDILEDLEENEVAGEEDWIGQGDELNVDSSRNIEEEHRTTPVARQNWKGKDAESSPSFSFEHAVNRPLPGIVFKSNRINGPSSSIYFSKIQARGSGDPVKEVTTVSTSGVVGLAINAGARTVMQSSLSSHPVLIQLDLDPGDSGSLDTKVAETQDLMVMDGRDSRVAFRWDGEVEVTYLTLLYNIGKLFTYGLKTLRGKYKTGTFRFLGAFIVAREGLWLDWPGFKALCIKDQTASSLGLREKFPKNLRIF
ncbi:hypothetical protein CRG98_011224 [Punica granatum]|uniref:Uncharacterized protein n=1 Tax=Punica granatum TaxID=22663 RepID=A0A2I0KIS8_PUNGR|nr:hypothetical protein CRG98_011224 [Punica granatum]